MTRRAGSADLPLHGGRVPAWLGRRMARLGAVIVEAIVLEYGRDELLRRLAHPFWFQSFGAVMGMDWHSSGITTSVIGALKRGLAPRARELGIHVCGGRGRHSRATPAELVAIGQRVGFDGDALASTSRLVAKVDSAAVQDGFDLYLHGFIVGDDGRWVVVQQGMNGERRQARRYHWLSEGLNSFVDAPHAAIEGRGGGEIVNLVDVRARRSREAQMEALRELGAEGVMREYARMASHRPRPSKGSAQGSLRPGGDRGASSTGMPRTWVPPGAETTEAPRQGELLPHLSLPDHHEVTGTDVIARRLHGNLAAAEANGPRDFAELLQVPGVGARTVRALAMVAEVLHGAPCRFSDPARFSLAHGGKDGHPFPVPTRAYDETIRVLKTAVRQAHLGHEEELAAIRRLDEQARRLEPLASGPSVEQYIDEERRLAPCHGGRTVFGWSR
jgi:hypothetical protein